MYKQFREKRTTAAWAAAILLLALVGGMPASAGTSGPFESDTALTPHNRIDELVFARWARLKAEPAKLCSDGVFVRRVYLDVIGTLPSGLEAREFLLDRSSDKRRVLIDRLLAREEFADYWTLKWGDLLRIKSEFPINLWPNAAQAYHRWVRASLRENQPYDQFVRELLTASGSNFRVPPVNFYRALQNKEPEGVARTVALTFMGVRAENWPKERRAQLTAFFSNIGYKSTAEWKEEIVFFDPASTNAGALGRQPRSAVLPDGKSVTLVPDHDPRGVFADWLLQPGNPWFSQNIANRVWAWLLGRGIIHEPDDVRPDNPPSDPALLAWLQQELVARHYDLKHLYRLILNSSTYQLSCIPSSRGLVTEAPFACYPLRQLDAEVLIDAINQITGSTEKYTSSIPEPFSYIPENQRSIALPDGSITSPFLELFGRPPRDTGLESERNNRPSAAQRLHLLNSTHIRRKIEQSRLVQYQTQPKRSPGEMVAGIYLGVLSRFPTEEELRMVEAYQESSGLTPREMASDLAWALINSAEFLHRH
jgi:hypothetical protein